MLIYSGAVALFLAYVGFAGSSSGMLLWPVVALHAIFAVLLARGSSSDEASKH